MLAGPQALPALKLEISFSISVDVAGKIQKLSGFNILRYSSGDLFTFEMELASWSPISAKYLQSIPVKIRCTKKDRIRKPAISRRHKRKMSELEDLKQGSRLFSHRSN